MNRVKLHRTDLQSANLVQTFDRLVRAHKADLLFAVDEYIVNLYNVFIAPTGSQLGDEKLLESLVQLSLICANSKNSIIIQNELSRLKTDGVSSYRRDKVPFLRVILSEDTRTKLRNLLIESDIYCPSLSLPVEDSKYIEDFETRCRDSQKVYQLINPKKQSSVLDIGTGTGLLPYIFKENGHVVHTFDISNCSKVFTKSCEILGVEKKDFTIKAFTKLLNLNKKFDIVVAKLICFNNHKQLDLWQRSEWLYFLEDIYQNQLEDEGVLWLGFNAENMTTLFLGSEDLHRLFNPFMNSTTRLARLTKRDISELILFEKNNHNG